MPTPESTQTQGKPLLLAAVLLCICTTFGCNQPGSTDTVSTPPVVVVTGSTPTPPATALSPAQNREIEKARAKGAIYAANAVAQEKDGAKRQVRGTPKPQPQEVLGVPTPSAALPLTTPTPPGHPEKRPEAPGSTNPAAEQAHGQ